MCTPTLLAGIAATGGTTTAATGFGAFLASPAFSLATSVIGFGVQMAGQSMQASIAQQQMSFQQQMAQQRALISQQDIKTETASEEARQRLLTLEGAQASGRLTTLQAGAGIGLGDEDSSATLASSDLAADIAFRKLVSRRESDLFKRQLAIESTGAQTNAAFLGAQKSASRTASSINQFGSVLTTASNLSRRFNFSDGNLSFRTT